MGMPMQQQMIMTTTTILNPKSVKVETEWFSFEAYGVSAGFVILLGFICIMTWILKRRRMK